MHYHCIYEKRTNKTFKNPRASSLARGTILSIKRLQKQLYMITCIAIQKIKTIIYPLDNVIVIYLYKLLFHLRIICGMFGRSTDCFWGGRFYPIKGEGATYAVYLWLHLCWRWTKFVSFLISGFRFKRNLWFF